MEFRRVRLLGGPNIWANFPVLEAWVDLGALKDSPSDELPGFNERLMAWLPSLIEHRCSVGRRGGFFERLRRGTWQAHILEHVALELQSLAGTPVGFGRTRETHEDGVYKVALEFDYEELGRASLEAGRDLCLAAVYDRPFDVGATIARLRELTQRLRPPAGETALIQAARQRRIPVCRLDRDDARDACPTEFLLGQGVKQQRVSLAHPLPAVDMFLDRLFPFGQTGRIPITAITGVNGKTTTTRLIAHILARTQRCVGMTCTDGIHIDGERVEAGDCSGPLSARIILRDPRVEAAVLETARGGILRSGLGFDRCDVAVVTNIAEGDHLGIGDIETVEQLSRVKRTIVEAVAPQGHAILKADDPLVAEMASYCPGSVVFFARDGQHPVLSDHRQRGGRAAFVRDRRIILAEGAQEIPLVSLENVPLTHGGHVGFQVENALAAAAAGWVLGVPCEVILAGLESFVADLDRAPARFNLLEYNDALVVMDYGHNTSSLASLIETFESLPHKFRSAVYSAAGDRRDVDLIRQGELLGDAFDRVVLYEEENCIRGRAPGEINALFRTGLDGRRRVKHIEEVQGAIAALEHALATARPGELLLVQVDLVDETIELMRRHLESGTSCRQIDLREALTSSRPRRRPATIAQPSKTSGTT
ncbi:MAG TPA: Mur ligase family protein [Gemmataceae bacterium]|nr:Mur ligase family protein [Gemmataceae bacterium]